MDPVNGYWAELAELTGRERLGWGNAGNSTMMACAYAGTRYVFKEYSDEFRMLADQNALGRLIMWRDMLPDEDRQYLDRIAAWPRYRVRRNGDLLGVLMPFAPKPFFRQTYPDLHARPNVIANLIRRVVDNRVIQGATVEVKTCAIGNAADILMWFHRQNVFVNDVRELNILCNDLGSAVYFVDCDVMFGPWGAVGPVAAPEYLLELVQNTRVSPSPEVELARLAWVAVWILLDDFSLRHIPQVQLTKVIDARDAELIRRTALQQEIRLHDWQGLANRWIKWTAVARVGPARTEHEVIPPRPLLPPTLLPTRMMPPAPQEPSDGWVPAKYRRPRPTASALLSPPPATAPTSVRERQPSERWPYLAVGGVFAALLLITLLAAAFMSGGT